MLIIDPGEQSPMDSFGFLQKYDYNFFIVFYPLEFL